MINIFAFAKQKSVIDEYLPDLKSPYNFTVCNYTWNVSKDLLILLSSKQFDSSWVYEVYHWVSLKVGGKELNKDKRSNWNHPRVISVIQRLNTYSSYLKLT